MGSDNCRVGAVGIEHVHVAVWVIGLRVFHNYLSFLLPGEPKQRFIATGVLVYPANRLSRKLARDGKGVLSDMHVIDPASWGAERLGEGFDGGHGDFYLAVQGCNSDGFVINSPPS